MFVATFYGGHLDGAIYECNDARAMADAIVADAGMMEVAFQSPIPRAPDSIVPSGAKLAEWFRRYSLWLTVGYVKIGDPSAADSMLVKVEVQ